MLEAWRPMLFADEDQAAKATRDPVAPAKRSSAALEKVDTHTAEDGTPAQSLRTLIAELATLVRNTCRTPGALEHPATFDILTTPSDSAAPRLRVARSNHRVVRNRTPEIRLGSPSTQLALVIALSERHTPHAQDVVCGDGVEIEVGQRKRKDEGLRREG